MSRSAQHAARIHNRELLAAERGTLAVGQPASVCLTYPSPYRVGMSSLGFQTLYRLLNERGIVCHRAFLPDELGPTSMPWPPARPPILSLEGERPLADHAVIGLSVAYELEIVGVLRLLHAAGIPLLAADRDARSPIVIAGGPLTDTNPSVLLPFVDVLVCGEAEAILPEAIERILGARDRDDALGRLQGLPHTILGEVEPGRFEPLPTCASAPRELLPAHSAITTPHTELADMFLIEPERGCSRQCTFCVMRGPGTGGMRLLAAADVLALIPQHARRVGLVGAAVTDHPELEALVASIVEAGRGIGISSLRADRLTPTLVDRLARGGYRQLTVASDGISERMRELLVRRIDAAALQRAAELVRDHGGLRGLKIYEMIGVPGEDDSDADELIGFVRELARITRITLTFSTFVAKRNTPLDGHPFVGVDAAQARLARITRGLKGVAEIRPQSPKWAHVEWMLAHHGPEAGRAALRAVEQGAGYRAWASAFAELGPSTRPIVHGDEAALARRKGKAARVRERLRVLP